MQPEKPSTARTPQLAPQVETPHATPRGLGPRWRTRPGRALLTVGLFLVPLAGFAVLLRAAPPTESPFYPRCQLHSLTGLHCPGCGLTRCAHALAQGDLLQALAWNALGLLLIPLILASAFQLWWGMMFGPAPRPLTTPGETLPRPSRFGNPGQWALALVVVMLLFGVLRNLPFEPFNLLAPHAIEPESTR